MSIEDIRVREKAATPGPWRTAHPRPDGRNLVERPRYDLYGGEVSEMVIVDTNPADAEFIAHARTDVPKLVAAIEAIDKLCMEIDTRSGYDVNASVNVEDIRGIIAEALS